MLSADSPGEPRWAFICCLVLISFLPFRWGRRRKHSSLYDKKHCLCGTLPLPNPVSHSTRGPPLDLLRQVYVLMLGAQELNAVLRVGRMPVQQPNLGPNFKIHSCCNCCYLLLRVPHLWSSTIFSILYGYWFDQQWDMFSPVSLCWVLQLKFIASFFFPSSNAWACFPWQILYWSPKPAFAQTGRSCNSNGLAFLLVLNWIPANDPVLPFHVWLQMCQQLLWTGSQRLLSASQPQCPGAAV